jgi:hypothetical protein
LLKADTESIAGNIGMDAVGVVNMIFATSRIATFPFGAEATGITAITKAGWAGGG